MQGKHWLIIVSAVSALVLAACEWKKPNSYRCPDGKDCPPAGGPCDSSGQCRAPTPVCNEDKMVCVECVQNSDCASARPLCDEQNTCVQCQMDDQCDSKLCLPGGACADLGDVTYVGGTNASLNKVCSIEMPCKSLDLDPMVPPRKYIKVTGEAIADAAATFDKKTVTIYGRSGAKISRSTAGEVLIIKMTSDVQILDLEIVGNATSSDKDCVEIVDTATVKMTRVNVHNHSQVGITLAGTAKLTLIESQVHDNTMDGVKALAGTTLELNRSSIYKNNGTAGVNATNTAMVTIDSSVIAANLGTSGGVTITGPFTIRNSIISANGNISSTTSAGGLSLNPVNATNAKFEFNTVADNVSQSTTSGLSCSIVSFDVSNSIFTNNTVNNCTIAWSLTGITVPPPTGTNKIGDPLFISKTLGDPMFYRIGSLSAARDSADPAATLDLDIDGQPRNDARKDMGADEYK